jgi:hypothetical protein
VCIWLACSKAVSIRTEVFLLADLLEKANNNDQSKNNDLIKNIRPIGPDKCVKKI